MITSAPQRTVGIASLSHIFGMHRLWLCRFRWNPIRPAALLFCCIEMASPTSNRDGSPIPSFMGHCQGLHHQLFLGLEVPQNVPSSESWSPHLFLGFLFILWPEGDCISLAFSVHYVFLSSRTWRWTKALSLEWYSLLAWQLSLPGQPRHFH